MKSKIIIFLNIISILFLAYGVFLMTDRFNIIIQMGIFLLLLYLSKSIFELFTTLYRLVLVSKNRDRCNSISVFPFFFLRSGNTVKITMNHFFTIKNRTYGSVNYRSNKLTDTFYFYCILIILILLSFLAVNSSGIAVISLSLLLYNIVTYYNFENLEQRLFDNYHYMLCLGDKTVEQNRLVFNLVSEGIESKQFYSEELIFLSYFSVFSFNRKEILDLEILKKINQYVLTQEGYILNVNYLEFIYIQIYCYNELGEPSMITELRDIILEFVDTISSNYLFSSNFRVTGRMKRNHRYVQEKRYSDIKIRKLYRSLLFKR